MNKRQGTFAAVALVAVLLAGATLARGHIRNSNGAWYFGGHTYNTDGEKKDPVNVIVKGADRKVNFTDVVELWDGDQAGTGDMGPALNTPFCASRQTLEFKRPHKLPLEHHNFKERCFHDAYHLRAWNSTPHDVEHHNDSLTDRDRFAVVAVHADVCCTIKDPKDKIGLPWEVAEATMIDEVGQWFCTYRDKYPIPGSNRHFQGWYTDGYASQVLPVPIAEDGPCPGS